LNAVGFNTSNQTEFDMLMELYNQAYINDYFVEYYNTFYFLQNEDYFAGGTSYGSLLIDVVSNYTINNFYYNTWKAFENGFFFALNLTSPFQLPSCYNEEQAEIEFEFYYYWGQTVDNSSISTVVANTNAYFNGEGAQYLSQLESLWQCYNNTEDQANVNIAIGYDVLGQEFYNMVQSWYQRNGAIYQQIFNQFYHFLEIKNNQAAGAILANFFMLVANSGEDQISVDFMTPLTDMSLNTYGG
jgi:hypothetical protein